ncbi:hypothetical protein WBK31_30590 [Nonomuraea sp. N2-4H]|uniref:hypothetical protein n=1 Tax=Nonomuraea sp. N2-4H TaxID=3128898 RepID=UPI00324E0343
MAFELMTLPLVLADQLEIDVLQRRPVDAQVGQLPHTGGGRPRQQRGQDLRGPVGVQHDRVPVGGGHGGAVRQIRQGRGAQAAGGGEADRGGHLAPPAQLADRPGLHDRARDDDGGPLRQRLHLVQVVGGQHGRLALVGEEAHQVPRLRPGLRVEPGGGLVQEDQVGVAHDADGDVEAA